MKNIFNSKLFFALAAVGIILVTAGCSKKGEATGVRKVHVANTNYYIPYDFVDEQGNSTGFEVEVLREVDKLLPDYEFVFHPVSDHIHSRCERSTCFLSVPHA